eukprot:6179367-Pleurochrysis_carterae.AAC.4
MMDNSATHNKMSKSAATKEGQLTSHTTPGIRVKAFDVAAAHVRGGCGSSTVNNTTRARAESPLLLGHALFANSGLWKRITHAGPSAATLRKAARTAAVAP